MKKFELVAEMSKEIEDKLSLVIYDESSPSCLRWVSSPSSNVKARQPAFAGISSNGYYKGSICNRKMFAHRVVWRLLTGEWPSGVIDHIDRNKRNNKFSNLRDTTIAGNNLNKSAKGYTVDKRTGKFVSMIKTNGKNRRIGTFESKEAAISAYIEAKKNLHGVSFHIDSQPGEEYRALIPFIKLRLDDVEGGDHA